MEYRRLAQRADDHRGLNCQYGLGRTLTELEAALRKAMAVNAPYLLEVRTRGDIPMPRTGYWDIADFLRLGND